MKADTFLKVAFGIALILTASIFPLLVVFLSLFPSEC